jgi:hypothetical protein
MAARGPSWLLSQIQVPSPALWPHADVGLFVYHGDTEVTEAAREERTQGRKDAGAQEEEGTPGTDCWLGIRGV